MDFHAEFRNSFKHFDSLKGLIFVDPDGEAILYDAPTLDEFDIKLTGAKAPIFLGHLHRPQAEERRPLFMELHFEQRYVLTVTLDQAYSITAICGTTKDKVRLRNYMEGLATKFNREIL